ncbi:SpaN/EivJ family type III secretion system needle length determinant [Enterobacter ludwigii]|uniref:SpaN/EivJ family type III secretion system needle length determinant n=1 Tax=Enterobacter ludwigii TaxID=299767 RepID=UPI003975543F
MKEINAMNVRHLSACQDERKPSPDKIGEMLKKRKFKSENNPEFALYELYSIKLTRHEQPQSLIMAKAGGLKEKLPATDKVIGTFTDPFVKQGTQTEGQGQQGAEKQGSTGANLPLHSNTNAVQKEVSSLHPGRGDRVNEADRKITDSSTVHKDASPLWPGRGDRVNEADRKTTDSSTVHKDASPLRPGSGDRLNEADRGKRREKSIAGSAGVLHASALAESSLRKAGRSFEISNKAQAQRTHYEEEKTSVKSEEMLKYHFRKWGGDHSVTIKENGAGNTLLYPSDEYVSYRLDQALKEKGESMWQLDDESGEHKHAHHDPDDGDEDD